MKRALYVLIFIAILFGSFHIASHYYRYELYDIAVQFESDKAGLNAKHKVINQSDYYYLHREGSDASKAVILLHGFSANKENWLRFSQELPNDISIYALDLLGHGQHAINLSTDYSIESQVDYLHQFIADLPLQTAHLVGNSMGGAIAALYAATYPDNVKTLMLISPAGVHEIPSELEIALEEGYNPLIASTVEEFYGVTDFVMEDQPFIPESILSVEAEKSIKRMALNQKIFKDIRSDLDKNLDQHFTNITSPTVILWGKQDRVIHADNINRYATLISNSSPILLDNVGHLAMIEAPRFAAKTWMDLESSN